MMNMINLFLGLYQDLAKIKKTKKERKKKTTTTKIQKKMYPSKDREWH